MLFIFMYFEDIVKRTNNNEASLILYVTIWHILYISIIQYMLYKCFIGHYIYSRYIYIVDIYIIYSCSVSCSVSTICIYSRYIYSRYIYIVDIYSRYSCSVSCSVSTICIYSRYIYSRYIYIVDIYIVDIYMY